MPVGYPPATVAKVSKTFRQALQNKHKDFPRGFVQILFRTLSNTKMAKLPIVCRLDRGARNN